MKKTDLDFRHLERPWSFLFEVIFSILRLKKIDQKGPKFNIKQQFYTKSTPQNPMSQSVFPDYEVGRSLKLIFKITIGFISRVTFYTVIVTTFVGITSIIILYSDKLLAISQHLFCIMMRLSSSIHSRVPVTIQNKISFV